MAEDTNNTKNNECRIFQFYLYWWRHVGNAFTFSQFASQFHATDSFISDPMETYEWIFFFFQAMCISSAYTSELHVLWMTSSLLALSSLRTRFHLTSGGLAIGVPGELSGLWALHEKYGSLPWADLLQPTIDLCINGAPLTQAMHDAIINVMKDIVNNTEFE